MADARSLEVSEGLGAPTPSTLPRAMVLFLEWSQSPEVKQRFGRFFDEHSVAFASNDDVCEDQSLERYEAFRSYENFFALETRGFLEEAKVDVAEFEDSCVAVRNRSGKAQKREYRDNEDEFGESKCQEDRRADDASGEDETGGLLLQMALSSLSYRAFASLMVDHQRRAREASQAAEDMGLF